MDLEEFQMDQSMIVFLQKLKDFVPYAAGLGEDLDLGVIREYFGDTVTSPEQLEKICEYLEGSGISTQRFRTALQDRSAAETDIFELVPFEIPEAEKNSEMLKLYLEEVADQQPLSEEELQRAAIPAAAGDEQALARLMQGALPISLSLAGRYAGQGVLAEDLIGEANMALISGARAYDPKWELSFYRYIILRIRQALARTIYLHQRGRKPMDGVADMMNRVLDVRKELEELYEREVTLPEIAGELGISTQRLETLIRLSRDPEDQEEDEGSSGEEDASSQDIIRAEDSDAVAALALCLEEVLPLLSPADQEILKTRIAREAVAGDGLSGTALVLGVKEDRIRRAEAMALHRYRRYLKA